MPEPQPATAAPRLTPLLVTYLRPQAAGVVVLALCLVTATALQLVGPQLTSRFIDLVAERGVRAPLAELELLAGLFILASIAAQLVRLGGAYFSASVGWRATNNLRLDLAHHALSLDMSFHNRRTAGELIERIDGDVSSMAAVFTQLVFQIFGSGLLMLGILAVLLTKDVLVGAVLGVFAAAAFAVLQKSRHLGVPLYAAERQARAELAGFIEERVGGLDDVRANGGGAHVMARIAALNADLTGRGVRAIRVAALFIVVITNAVFITGFGLALGLGVWLFQSHRATLGSVYLMLQYTQMMRAPLESIGTQIQALQRAMASVGRVQQLAATPVVIRDGPGAPLAAAAPSVEFARVSFAYDESRPVLNEVSFRLEAGETLGLLGRTGSGKTTITRLIARLYDPTSGAVRLNERDVRDAALSDLRAHVGVVTQDVQLFGASIRENLTFFDEVADAWVVEALEDLGLGPWLARQADGLDTLLDAGASQLSAGEAQLLAFARVFLKDPGLVLLDEASSRLDPATDRLVEIAMEKLLGRQPTHGGRRRTAIIVAHKLATVRRVDRIAILEHGRIVEAGPRSALAADPRSRFAGLLRSGLDEALA